MKTGRNPSVCRMECGAFRVGHMRRVGAKPVVDFSEEKNVTDKTLLLSESGKQSSPKKSRVR